MAGIIVGLLPGIASNAMAWCMIVRSSAPSLASLPQRSLQLRSAVWKIALAYFLWGMFHKHFRLKEYGFDYTCFGMMFAVLATNMEQNAGVIGKIALLITCGIVVLNFVAVIVVGGGIAGVTTHINKNGVATVWRQLYTAYMCSNIFLWSYCGFLFYKLPVDVIGQRDDNEGTIREAGDNDELHQTKPLRRRQLSRTFSNLRTV